MIKVLSCSGFPTLKGDLKFFFFENSDCQDLRALAPDVEELLSTYQLTLQELIADPKWISE